MEEYFFQQKVNFDKDKSSDLKGKLLLMIVSPFVHLLCTIMNVTLKESCLWMGIVYTEGNIMRKVPLKSRRR